MVSEQQIENLLKQLLSLQNEIRSLTDRLNAAESFPKMEPAGSGTPGAGDDEDDGFSVFSLWYYSGNIWICEDASTGSAVWTQIT